VAQRFFSPPEHVLSADEAEAIEDAEFVPAR